MPGPLKFTMNPKDDLSTRPDFAFDLMQEISKVAKEALDASAALSGIREKADVKVSATGALRTVSISVDVSPKEGVEMTAEEVSSAKAEAMKELKDAMDSKMSEVMQSALNSARGRM